MKYKRAILIAFGMLLWSGAVFSAETDTAVEDSPDPTVTKAEAQPDTVTPEPGPMPIPTDNVQDCAPEPEPVETQPPKPSAADLPVTKIPDAVIDTLETLPQAAPLAAEAAQFAGGDGTEANPYQIATRVQLAALADLAVSGLTAGQHYILINDIDINRVSWTPIGSQSTPFDGYLDGGGYQVINLSLTTNDMYVGLFGTVTGTVKNLTLRGSVSGKFAVGGIAGMLGEGGIIYNCANHAMVYGTMNSFGGIVGLVKGGCVENCYNTAQIGTSPIELQLTLGGIAGSLRGGTLRNCYNTGNIIGNNTMGGIAGSVDSEPTCVIENCYSIGTVDYGNGGGVIGSVTAIEATKVFNNFYAYGTAKTGAGTKSYADRAWGYEKTEMQTRKFAEKLGSAYAYVASMNSGYPVLRSSLDKQFGEIILTQDRLDKEYGCQPFYLEYELVGDGALVFESDTPSVAQVSANGEVTITGAGTAVITITMAETDAFYAADPKTVTVQAAKATLRPTPAELPVAGKLTYGQTLSDAILKEKWNKDIKYKGV